MRVQEIIFPITQVYDFKDMVVYYTKGLKAKNNYNYKLFSTLYLYFVIIFEKRFHVAHTGLKLTKYPTMTLNS